MKIVIAVAFLVASLSATSAGDFYQPLPIHPRPTVTDWPCGSFTGGLRHACIGQQYSEFSAVMPVNSRNFSLAGVANYTQSGASATFFAGTGVWEFDRNPTTRYLSAAAINSNAGLRATSAGFAWRGDGDNLGGFDFVTRGSFGGVSGHFFVAGLAATDPTLTGTPSTTIVNGYYIGFDSGQTTLRACSCGSPAGNCDCADTGLEAVTGTHMFDMVVTCPGEGAFCGWEVIDLVTGSDVVGLFSTDPTKNPASNLFMAPKFYCGTDGSTTACAAYLVRWFTMRPY